MKWGAIFDWDGVIIDSSAHHEESWERLAAETGHTLPPGHFKRGFGIELYREIVKEWGIAPLPGVVAWLDSLRDRGIPCAIGSSTHRLNISTGLSILGFTERFAAVITAEDVRNGKPDPEVFLTAAARIGLAPERCVVFEDALVGIEAAHRGSMQVVAVATTNPISILKQADVAVHRLDELTVDQLASQLVSKSLADQPATN